MHRRLGWITAALALLMAADRVYVGAHWPLDFVAGLCVGAVVAVLVTVAAQTPVAALVQRLTDTPLRPLLTAEPTAQWPVSNSGDRTPAPTVTGHRVSR